MNDQIFKCIECGEIWDAEISSHCPNGCCGWYDEDDEPDDNENCENRNS